MKGLIGKKLGMTQIYDEKGVLIPVTVIQAGPCVVLDLKTKEKHGYSALQLGFGVPKAKNKSKALCGHCEKAGRKENPPSFIREIRTEKDPELAVGTEIKADLFAVNDFIDVSGVIKGKGFAGVMKRHNFKGGRDSHGGGWHRKPGSIGCREIPGNVIKGKKLPGQLGNALRTVQNLKVVRVDAEDNLLFIRGAIPGATGGTILVKSAKKK